MRKQAQRHVHRGARSPEAPTLPSCGTYDRQLAFRHASSRSTFFVAMPEKPFASTLMRRTSRRRTRA